MRSRAGRERRGAGKRDLLAEHGADRDLVGVGVAGHPSPGALRTIFPISSSLPSASTIGAGSVSRSSRRRARRHRGVEIVGALSHSLASTSSSLRPAPGRNATTPDPARQADAADIDVAVDLLDPRNGSGGEEPHQAGDVARRAVRQPELDRGVRRSEPEDQEQLVAVVAGREPDRARVLPTTV